MESPERVESGSHATGRRTAFDCALPACSLRTLLRPRHPEGVPRSAACRLLDAERVTPQLGDHRNALHYLLRGRPEDIDVTDPGHTLWRGHHPVPRHAQLRNAVLG